MAPLSLDVIYELEGKSAGGVWRMIYADESLDRSREKVSEYRAWNETRLEGYGWSDFRIVKVTTTREIVP